MKKKLNPLVIFLVVGIPLYFLANFIRNGIPGAIFNELQKDLNTTAKGVTALGASFMYVYALSQLITGVLCDRYGGYRTMLYGCPLFLIGVLAFPFVDNIVVLCLLRAIAAFGASIIYLSLAKEMTSKAPEHFSLLLGLVCFIGFLGGVTAGQPFSSLASSIGWKNSILGVGVIACLLYLAIPLVKKTQGTLPEIRQIPFSVKVFARIFKTGGTWRIVASFSIAYGVAFALCTVIAKKYLEDCCQYSVKASGIVMSLMFLSMAISSIGMGFLSKLFNNRRLIFGKVCCISTAILLLMLTLFTIFGIKGFAPGLVFVLVPLIASYGSVAMAQGIELNRPEDGGMVVSIINFLVYVVVALAGNISGLLLDFFGFTLNSNGDKIYHSGAYAGLFGLLGLFAVYATYNAWQLPETWGKNINSRFVNNDN
jgi:MFS family permease